MSPLTPDPQATTISLAIQVDGRALPDMVEVVRVVVESNRALPDVFECTLLDPDRVALGQAGVSLGSTVKIGVGFDGAAPTWIHQGEVTALEMEKDSAGDWTVVRGYDLIHRLQRGRSVAAYRNQSMTDIVKTVLGRAGVPVGPLAAGPRLTEVIQANENDWSFLARLASDVGMELFSTEGKVGLRDPIAASGSPDFLLTLGENILQIRASVSASDHADEVQVRVWDPKAKETIVGRGDAKTTAGVQIGIKPSATASPFGARVLSVTDAPYAINQDHATRMAKSLAEQVAGAFAEIEVEVQGNPKITCGSRVKLEGTAAPFDGSYVVTAARHVLADGDYRVHLTASGGTDRTLLGLVSRTGSGRSGTGLVPGIVTNTKDPDGLGRVKVKLPWMDDQLETDWARTLQMGGKGGGGLIVPEVDDEVLVGFEQGHLERPFVLGGLYNSKDKPGAGGGAAVDSSSGAISRRALASRSGNRVEIVDVPNGDNGIRLTTGDDRFLIYLDKKNTTITVTSGGKIEISGESDISITSKGNATLEAKGNLTLKASGNIKAEAMANLELTASASAKLSGNAKVEVSGAMADLKGSAVTTISGGIVKIN